jgi:8-oxo-dGTP pyrophosphatase MutT (NUDIX family)
VSCVVQDGDRLLLLKRSEMVGTFQGHWATVSGFIEEGESPSQAAAKELREETGLSIPYCREGSLRTIRNDDIVWHIHPYLFRVHDPVVQIDWEHTEFCWIRLNELAAYRTVPGLAEMIRDLL